MFSWVNFSKGNRSIRNIGSVKRYRNILAQNGLKHLDEGMNIYVVDPTDQNAPGRIK